MANDFKYALPPTVSAAVKELMTIVTNKIFRSGKASISLATIVTAQPPETIPQISPMTSAQKLLTFSAFLTSFIAVLAPATRLLAQASKGGRSHDATDIATASKATFMAINNNNKSDAIMILVLDDAISVTRLNNTANKKVDTVMTNAQCLPFLRVSSFLLRFFLVFDWSAESSICFLCKKIASEIIGEGSVDGRPCALGSDGFPHPVLTVAE